MTDQDAFNTLKGLRDSGNSVHKKYQVFVIIAKNGEFKHIYETMEKPNGGSVQGKLEITYSETKFFDKFPYEID